MPQDLKPILEALRIDQTIAVQTSPIVAETDFLLELAETADFIGGVVGWLDIESTEFPRALERYRQNRRFVAVRPMLESLPNNDWILRPRVIDSLSLIAQAGVAFEFLTYTRHLPYVLKALDRLPNLRCVIDHLSKPEIRAGGIQPWQDLMREVALHQNVHCKLSGLVTEADPQNWNLEQLRPYVNHILEHFGGERMMFGSDWPVCLVAASYEQVLEVARNLVAQSLGPAGDAVFGDNAARFYRLENITTAAGV